MNLKFVVPSHGATNVLVAEQINSRQCIVISQENDIKSWQKKINSRLYWNLIEKACA